MSTFDKFGRKSFILILIKAHIYWQLFKNSMINASNIYFWKMTGLM